MKHILVTILVTALSAGCDLHVDSVCLGRDEARLLGHVSAGNLAAVKKFLDQGGNVNPQDEPGMTPLHHAVNDDWKGSHLEMIKLLIDREANVKAIDDTRHTPLHLASKKETAELLIAAGADVNVKLKSGSMLKDNKPYREKTGETILHQVARSYSEKHAAEICELLIANGTKVNEPNGKGQSPLDEALSNGRKKTAEFLRTHGAGQMKN